MRSEIKNIAMVFMFFSTLLGLIFLATSNIEKPAEYHIAVHCGTLGDYEIEPNTIEEYDNAGRDMFSARKMDGELIIFPKSCIMEMFNYPGDTATERDQAA